jgi:hypothetical protein
MMGGLGLDDEDLDDDDLEAMLSQMPPGMFEQMLREDAGKGGAAGEEADALLSMLSQMGAHGGMDGGDGGMMDGMPPDLVDMMQQIGMGGGGGGGGGRRRGKGGGRGTFRRGKSGGAIPPTFVVDRDAVDVGDDSEDEPTPSGTPGANHSKNQKKKEKKKKAKKARAAAVADAGGAGDATTTTTTTTSVPSAAAHASWNPKPSTSRQPPPGSIDRAEGKRWIDAAKEGNIGTMRGMLGQTPTLLYHRSAGVGHTALHWACARGESAVVDWLLFEVDADANALNAEGATPLHAAASNGQMAAVLSLARAGADPNRRDENGGAFYTLVPIRPRRRGERRSLRTFPGVSLRPHLAFNPRPRRLSTPADAFQLHPNFALYGTTRRHPWGSGGEAFARGSRRGVRFRRERRRRS